MVRLLAGHAAAHAIARAGVSFVTGVPGESYLPIIDGLYTLGIPYVTMRHESGAGFMGIGAARASGVPGVVTVTRGPGAANVTIAVHEAYQSSTPLVVIVGQVQSRIRGWSAFQEVDFPAAFAPYAKAAWEVHRPDRVGPEVARALQEAVTGRPGPVVVSVPSDLLEAEVADPDLPGPAPVPRPALGDGEAEAIVAAAAAARRGLLFVGAGIVRAGAGNLARQLAERLGLGVVGSHGHPGVLAPDDPLYLGTSTLRPHPQTADTVAQADFILVLGDWFLEKSTLNFSRLRARLMAVAPSPEVPRAAYPHADHYVAEPVTALRQLLAIAPDEAGAGPAAPRAGVGERPPAGRASPGPDSVVPSGLDPARVVAAIAGAMGDRSGVVVTDAGAYNDWVLQHFPFGGPRRYVGPTSGSMGFGLPAALGWKRVRREDTVVVTAGDGGFLMTANELATAVRYEIPVTCVVFNNNLYGSIALNQMKAFPDHPYGVALQSPSFSRLAESFGALGFAPASEPELAEALATAIHSGRPAVIEVAVPGELLSPRLVEGDHRAI